MNRFLLFTLSVWLLTACHSGSLQWEQTVLDLGKVVDKTNALPLQMVYRNTGNETISIIKIIPSCSYLSVSDASRIIQGNTSDTLKLMLHTDRIDGTFATRVQVFTDQDKKPFDLLIKGEVMAGPQTLEEQYPHPFGRLRLNHKTICFGDIYQHQLYTDTIKVYNPTDTLISLDVLEGTENVKLLFLDHCVRPQKTARLLVSLQVNNAEILGHLYEDFRLELDGRTEYRNYILVDANVLEDFTSLTADELQKAPEIQIEESTFDFGEVKQGEEIPHTFVIHNKGKRDLVIRKVLTSCGCTAIVPGNRVVPPGDATDLKMIYKSAGKQGAQQKSILVITNDPLKPEVKLWVKGIIHL
ncbi:MAG: DUF1573 domain-containing protein [Odoribacter sp.]